MFGEPFGFSEAGLWLFSLRLGLDGWGERDGGARAVWLFN